MLDQALLLLSDVDEDSPKEAQALRGRVLEESQRPGDESGSEYQSIATASSAHLAGLFRELRSNRGPGLPKDLHSVCLLMRTLSSAHYSERIY